MKKELYEVTRVRGNEKKELGSYLLKPGPEAAMDFFHNILKRDDKLEVSIKSTETGFSLTDNSEPDVSYIMTLVPMDDSFWETCTASKNRLASCPVCPLWVGGFFVCVNRVCGFLLTCFANRVQYSLYDR